MTEIVFDFSSSPSGGGLRRVSAYVDYFSKSSIKTHFFISDALSFKGDVSRKVKTTIVKKSNFDKLTLRNDYFSVIQSTPQWLYSYGIPIRSKIAVQNWLHVSNVMPFTFRECTLRRSLYWKSFAQFQQHRLFAHNADYISGESQFTIDKFKDVLGWKGSAEVLKNGVTRVDLGMRAKENYALVVGTDTYKRADLSYAIFRNLRSRLNLNSIVFVGDPDGIPPMIRNSADVFLEQKLTNEELVSRFERASYFISTSEVENSSLAALEGLSLTGKAILSDIPSHREMLINEPEEIILDGKTYLLVDNENMQLSDMPQWDIEIEKMLSLMRGHQRLA